MKSFLLVMTTLAALAVSGCKSHHIEVTVENRTGAAIRLLEVDYPSASFGADLLAPGAILHYRIQVQGNGPVKVQYSNEANHPQPPIQGPEVVENQQGTLEIVLEPDGKASFHPGASSPR